ncbi:MAG: hemolysin family protein [Candidatus Aminicenantes bacterium]
MLLLYVLIFIILVFFSAFFSSAETALLSLNKIKLHLSVKKKNKKARMLEKILEKPEAFFSTILIGNNFVNIGAASISTVLFTRLLVSNEQLILLTSTLVTTIIILLFAEIIPKSYAFRHNKKISYLYAYPLKFFTYLFYPMARVTTFISNLVFKKDSAPPGEKELTMEEVKHFLTSQSKLFRYNPEALRMVKEIIDIAEKDIKSIMTPRLNIIALEENASSAELKKIILGKQITKVPIYADNLDNITGIIYTDDVLYTLLEMPAAIDINRLDLKKIIRSPIFISEYSSLNYAWKQFKKHKQNIAVIIDEYGSTIGILTLNDIFKEILGELKIQQPSIRKTGKNSYLVNGNTSVDEVNEQLHVHLPDKPDYTTMSGLFIYHFGKFPKEENKIKIEDTLLVVKRMGKRKIEEIRLICEDKSI